MDNYKGLYYKESKEQRFYEGGAHFSFEELYKVLLYLKEEQDKSKEANQQQKENLKNQNSNKISILSGINSNICKSDLLKTNNNNFINNINKGQHKTRNAINNCFNNNPNTKIKKNSNKNGNRHLSIGISYNYNKNSLNSRNNNNKDFNLYYNRTSNQINNDMNYFQDSNLSWIKNKSSNIIQKRILGKNNSTNQIKNKKLIENIYLYNNLNNELKLNYLKGKNKKNDSFILNGSKKINIIKTDNIEIDKNIINIKNNNKVRKINSTSNKYGDINKYINNGLNNKKYRNNSGINKQIPHNINNYINVNINSNNNINVNINNLNYKNSNNRQINLNQILMSLIKSTDQKYQNQKERIRKNEKNNSDSLFNHIKISKSRNIYQKSGLCHVKSMDYNNKPLNTDLLGISKILFMIKLLVIIIN
jgi:hypothetical protein